MKKLSLNALQIAHQTNPCSGEICSLESCGICLCGKRSDADFCCDEHKALKNNKEQKTNNSQNKLRNDINKKNTIMVEDLYARDYRKLDFESFRLRGFDFSGAPFPGIVNGRRVALYGTIALWVDELLMINLEKI
ncbi:MAG: hypothetical protein IPL10_12245 [Bacteroidetes bacterium]|jgi:hypothetical protein|nr:hypothetical protein [Bacteroidota bacterium]